ncbi:hypothetical protein L7F22_034412 [Adiantum nelumboides]|nr:hypothetical protein [Adiantum nelumboides]
MKLGKCICLKNKVEEPLVAKEQAVLDVKKQAMNVLELLKKVCASWLMGMLVDATVCWVIGKVHESLDESFTLHGWERGSGMSGMYDEQDKEHSDTLFEAEDVAHDASVDDLPMLRILKEHFTLAFPYISVATKGGELLNTLVSSIKDNCNVKSRPGKRVIVGSCAQGTFDPKLPILAEGIELVNSGKDLKVVFGKLSSCCVLSSGSS